MPFIRVDPEMFDEVAQELGDDAPSGERPSGAFEYESAEARFDGAKLGPVARVVCDALLAAGANAFRVRYDGGYDEGFTHPDSVQFGPDLRSIERVAGDLANAELVTRIRAAAGKNSMWGNAGEMYAKAQLAQAFTYALDELAYELAAKLLGDGFGTGEYQLYGAFTADLKTGEIADFEDAAKPLDMD